MKPIFQTTAENRLFIFVKNFANCGSGMPVQVSPFRKFPLNIFPAVLFAVLEDHFLFYAAYLQAISKISYLPNFNKSTDVPVRLGFLITPVI
ncbi:MAG: hypothetical protein WAT19_12915 [Ferruginibacter sp.]